MISIVSLTTRALSVSEVLYLIDHHDVDAVVIAAGVEEVVLVNLPGVEALQVTRLSRSVFQLCLIAGQQFLDRLQGQKQAIRGLRK